MSKKEMSIDEQRRYEQVFFDYFGLSVTQAVTELQLLKLKIREQTLDVINIDAPMNSDLTDFQRFIVLRSIANTKAPLSSQLSRHLPKLKQSVTKQSSHGN